MKFKNRLICLILIWILGCLYYLNNTFFYYGFKFNASNHSKSNTSNFQHSSDKSCYSFKEPATDLSSFKMLKEASKKLWEDHKSKSSGELFPDLNALKTKSNKELMTVFVVPHSHNDPAWTKTFEELTEDERNLFISFLKEGRLEIAGGGWIAPDEATTTIHGLIENLVQGHSWLAENLPGIQMPKTWWNLDPFGYSSVGAYLATKAGYKRSTILRVNSYIKEIMQLNQQLEFDWSPAWLPPHVASKFNTFTSILPFILYNIKYSCGPHPQVCLKYDFRAIPGEMSESLAQPINDQNVEPLSELLHQQLRYKAQMTKHNAVMFLLGDDFRYDREAEWEQQYENFQRLFNFMNKRSDWNVKIRFGTPTDYFNEVDKQMTTQRDKFPTLKGDFYTYYDRDWAFWSGYFTSRPYFKWLARKLGHDLRTAEILTSLNFIHQLGKSAHSNRNIYKSLQSARQMYAFFHHHDSITGTSSGYVTQKYLEDLNEALSQTRTVISTLMPKLLKPHGITGGDFTMVDVTFKPDGPVIPLPKSNSLLIYLFNSVSQTRTDCVTFQVHSPTLYAGLYENGGESMRPLPCQISPAFENTRISNELFEATVCVTVKPWAVQPLLLSSTALSGKLSKCSLSELSSNRRFIPPLWSASLIKQGSGLILLSGRHLKARFDPNSGLMKEVAPSSNSDFVRVSVKLQYYNSKGGSYLFMPDENAPAREDLFERPNLFVVRGPLLSYIRVEQNAYIHTVRLYNVNDPGCHLNDVFVMENLVNLQTAVKNFDQKELFLRLDTQLNSKDIFYTDSNNVFLTKRQKMRTLPLEGNYYPITSALMIEDSNTRMTILTNHAHGVTSRFSGSVEVMLQRAATMNDDRGNSEALSYDHPAISRMFLLFEDRGRGKEALPVESVAFLSSGAALYSRFLNHPMTPLLQTRKSSLVRPVSLLPQLNIPCNIEVLNLRWSPTAGHVLAIIRNSPDLQCQGGTMAWKTICKGQFDNGLSFRRNLLASGSLKSVSLANLSGVKVLADLDGPDFNTTMVPGDFNTFILKF